MPVRVHLAQLHLGVLQLDAIWGTLHKHIMQV